MQRIYTILLLIILNTLPNSHGEYFIIKYYKREKRYILFYRQAVSHGTSKNLHILIKSRMY